MRGAGVAIEGMVEVSRQNHTRPHAPNEQYLRERLTQFHRRFQHLRVPLVEAVLAGPLTPMMSRLPRTWGCVEIKRFAPSALGYVRRPLPDRAAHSSPWRYWV